MDAGSSVESSTGLRFAVRLASPDVDYPLPTSGPARWHGGRAPVAIELPDIPAGHVIAASFASTSTAAPFAFRLDTSAGRFETARFGHHTRRRERARGTGVAVPVDYFHTARDLTRPVLRLLCRAPEPSDHLLTVSIRPSIVAPPTTPPSDAPPVPATRLSQTTLAKHLRDHACSPTATAMALGISAADDFAALVIDARHSPTGMLGVWPQNLWAAARRGVLAAVELISDWGPVSAALAAGTPVVASTRFKSGALPGSPIEATAGHLVLVRGIAGGQVVVNDPAAPPHSVARRYDAGPFADAWMRHRGAAYVFARRRREETATDPKRPADMNQRAEATADMA